MKEILKIPKFELPKPWNFEPWTYQTRQGSIPWFNLAPEMKWNNNILNVIVRCSPSHKKLSNWNLNIQIIWNSWAECWHIFLADTSMTADVINVNIGSRSAAAACPGTVPRPACRQLIQPRLFLIFINSIQFNPYSEKIEERIWPLFEL